MQEKVLSIAIAMYNGEKYIERCLNSVRTSINKERINKSKIEVLIIDDGSKDNSKKIAENFIQGENLIDFKVLTKENEGLSSVRNYAIKYSKGEYVWLLDCDDTIVENAIETIFLEIEEKKDIYIFKYNIYKSSGEFLGETSTFDYSKDISDYKDKLDKFVLSNFKESLFFEPASWHYVLKKSLFIKNKISFPIGYIYEDLGTTCKLLLKASSIKYVNKVIYDYYWNENSIMRNDNIEKRRDIIYILSSILYYFKNENLYDEYKDELEYLCIKHIHYIYESIYKIKKHIILSELSNFLIENFPNWEKNKYFKKESFKRKIRYKLELNNKYYLLKLLML